MIYATECVSDNKTLDCLVTQYVKKCTSNPDWNVTMWNIYQQRQHNIHLKIWFKWDLGLPGGDFWCFYLTFLKVSSLHSEYLLKPSAFNTFSSQYRIIKIIRVVDSRLTWTVTAQFKFTIEWLKQLNFSPASIYHWNSWNS